MNEYSFTAAPSAKTAETVSPEELVDLALRTRSRGNIGIAFTYNEPLIGYEFVRDTARLAKNEGLKNVMVTNGTAELAILAELSPYIDAMNIDLKGFTDCYYSKVLGGDRQQVMLVEIEPGASREAVSGDGNEILYMVSGRVDYRIGNDIIDFGPGDVLFFDSSVPHVPENRHSKKAVMLAVYHLNEPVF